MVALVPERVDASGGETSNVQRPTSNVSTQTGFRVPSFEGATPVFFNSKLDVGRWTLDVFFHLTISDLPAINASLNFISAIFISAGWYLIRRGHWRRHVACMIPALISSTLFLVGYLVYHAHVGERSTHFTAQGIIRPIYFAILISHILLAFVILPLVILTLVPVFRRRWERHARIARWTMPIWLYVSITGVLVYLMLYKWFPPGS
jgi:putative membrane protein